MTTKRSETGHHPVPAVEILVAIALLIAVLPAVRRKREVVFEEED